MKSIRLNRLQTGTLGLLSLYILLLIYMVFFAIPSSNPMWNNGQAEWHIQKATTLPELQEELRSAVHNLTWGLHLKNQLLLTFLISTTGMIGFLGWSLFMVSRIKKENSIDPLV